MFRKDSQQPKISGIFRVKKKFSSARSITLKQKKTELKLNNTTSEDVQTLDGSSVNVRGTLRLFEPFRNRLMQVKQFDFLYIIPFLCF